MYESDFIRRCEGDLCARHWSVMTLEDNYHRDLLIASAELLSPYRRDATERGPVMSDRLDQESHRQSNEVVKTKGEKTIPGVLL
nr:hypothetical protein CFP56_46607 [Quercus suber]